MGMGRCLGRNQSIRETTGFCPAGGTPEQPVPTPDELVEKGRKKGRARASSPAPPLTIPVSSSDMAFACSHTVRTSAPVTLTGPGEGRQQQRLCHGSTTAQRAPSRGEPSPTSGRRSSTTLAGGGGKGARSGPRAEVAPPRPQAHPSLQLGRGEVRKSGRDGPDHMR